ncbi:hypothetical protein [Yinghuangia soli]|uniref:PknH-like extracellular domain-containing protein n=1 Tax=Yinghuangia soli TaxID=2908204 RepID=A0AA41PUV3_9ACTN|nr:hypothetical protein [Yinghuangia soli]MCF2526173.1 hypothetical protein [Yinghuangia soli]
MRSARARLTGAALVPLLLLTTACLGDDKDEDAKAGNAAQSSAPSAAPGAAASGSAAPGGAGASQAPGKVLGAAELQGLLVTQKELGPGWTVKPSQSTGYGSIGMKAVPAAAKCQPLLDVMAGSALKPAAYAAEVLESAADKHSWVDLTIARFESADAIAAQVDAVAKLAAAQECLEFDAVNTKNETTSYRFVFAVPQPKLADGSAWITVFWSDPKSMKDPTGTANSAEIQLVRSGAVLVKMVGLSESRAYSSDAVPDAQVKTQVDKVVKAVKG